MRESYKAPAVSSQFFHLKMVVAFRANRDYPSLMLNFIDKTKRKHTKLPRWKRYQLLEEYNFQCAYCETPLTIENSVSDHFAPFNLVRETKYKNMVPACYTCNASKRDRIFTSIYEVRQFINYIRVSNNLPALPAHLLTKPQMAEVLQPPVPHSIQPPTTPVESTKTILDRLFSRA